MIQNQPGITKTFTPHDWPGLVDELHGHLTTFFTRDHVKQAASELFSKKDLDEHSPPPGHFMIHQVVMGSEEGYGPNNNQDSWPAEMLRREHQTFVTNGHVFREHRNNDPKFAIGSIKAARFSEKLQRVELLKHLEIAKAEKEYEMAKAGKELHASMACFPAGTQVRMDDWTEKPIEKIKVGDRVLTHKGNIGVVSHTMQRSYSDIGVAIRAYGLPEEVICTKDHGVWTRPALNRTDPCPVCGEIFTSLSAHLWQKKDAKHQAAKINYSKYCEGFRAAGALRKKDYLRTAVSNLTTSAGEVWLARLLGFYLAEGSLFMAKSTGPLGSPRSDFTFHIKETAHINEVAELIEKFTNSAPYIRTRPAGNSTFVRSTNRALFHWLLENGGKNAEHKRISPEVMQWRPEIQKHILEAWLEGDGTWSKINEILSGTTVSRTLAIQMMEIAARCGLNANLQSHQPKIAHHMRAYLVVFSSTVCHSLNVSKKPEGWKCDKTYATSYGHLKYQNAETRVRIAPAQVLSYVENGFIYRRIARLRQVFINEIVYDLTVPGDHGFQVGIGIGVSNCKVPFDSCSCCDNRAKYAALYCKHLKNHLGQWMPEFKKYAFARNPQGTFFDSSIVANPAARMAKHLEYRFGPDLQKAASAKVVLSGAQWAEFDQADLGNRFTLDSNSTKLLHKLAAVEGHKGKDNYRAAVSRFAFMPKSSMDDTSWKKVADLMPGSLFHKLAQRRILLPFDAFVAYTTDQTISEVRSNPDTIKCASMLPGIFRALASALETGGCCCGQHDMDMFSGSGNSATAFDPGASDEIDRVMEQASEDWSCDPEPIKSRAVKVIVIKRASINSVMDAPAIRAIPPIVQLYGLYKLAALRDILSMTRDQNAEHEMLRLSVDQNLNDQESLTEKV